ncbi:hypothetical protein [Agromyces seonyuensis]|uniref:Zinc-ribbon domain-containing protein n=1 Tax=Agromyces seonyuensis TaxID=2662446 RepID=A0A6I4NXC0_9MICO|nr:hypothetical protein [Agromyces seonyuensis]MWB97762.1 hypothetical protein [Agromyces seonyuensis]
MTAVAFACGHGAVDAALRLRRACPVCMLIAETHRSRSELLGRVVPLERAALAIETRIGATYTWRCTRGHDRYEASIREALTGTGCRKCRANAAGPSVRREAGVPFMNPGLRTRTSMTEQRLKTLLGERIRLQHRVNAVHVARPFYGRLEVWPDIVIPELRVAVEYDSPGRSGGAHRGLKAGSDLEKDDLLREVGWDVIRIRSEGLEALGPNSVVCRGLTVAAVDEVVVLLRRLRGDDAVDALLVRAEAS